MARCKDLKTTLGTTLQVEVDPCPWPAGFSSPRYMADIENRRTSEIQNVYVFSKALHGLATLHPNSISIYSYIPKQGGRYQAHKNLIQNGPNNGPDKILTTVTFVDELTPSVTETLSGVCEFDVP